MKVTKEDIVQLRLSSHRLNASKAYRPQSIVEWMGAMQAQDLKMSLLAVAIRSSELSLNKVEHSFNKGSILRTHLMRPTWHLVSAKDIRWLLQLTAPSIKKLLTARHRQLNLHNKLLVKSNDTIVHQLSTVGFASREDLKNALTEKRIRTDENRLSHLLLYAELCGLICSGPLIDGDQRYALFDDRVAVLKPISEDEAISKLADKYFSSHAPATVDDFAWWSGLNVTKARRAIDIIARKLEIIVFDNDRYFSKKNGVRHEESPKCLFLPAYDEFVISYKNRNAFIGKSDINQAISANGIFYPTVLLHNKVVAVWKFLPDDILEITAFKKLTAAERKEIAEAAQQIQRRRGHATCKLSFR